MLVILFIRHLNEYIQIVLYSFFVFLSNFSVIQRRDTWYKEVGSTEQTRRHPQLVRSPNPAIVVQDTNCTICKVSQPVIILSVMWVIQKLYYLQGESSKYYTICKVSHLNTLLSARSVIQILYYLQNESQILYYLQGKSSKYYTICKVSHPKIVLSDLL